MGKDFLLWEPDSRKDVFEKKSGKTLPAEAQNMLEAMVTLKVTDSPWKEWRILEKVTWALNGHIPNMFIMEKPPSHYLAYAVYIMKGISDEELSEECLKYIASVLAEEGIVLAIKPLEQSQKYLDTFIEDKSIIDKVKSKWTELLKYGNLDKYTPDINDQVSAQMSKLLQIELYIHRKETLLQEEIK
jgi:hypothetical protein